MPYIDDISMYHHSGPTPAFMWEKLTEARTAFLAQAVLGRKACQVENRKGNNRLDGWKPKGPDYEHQLPVSGKRWITVLEGS